MTNHRCPDVFPEISSIDKGVGRETEREIERERERERERDRERERERERERGGEGEIARIYFVQSIVGSDRDRATLIAQSHVAIGTWKPFIRKLGAQGYGDA